MKRWELRFTGYGGQGVITAGLIFGRAACIHAGLDVVMYESYGPEITGGFSRADLVISDTTIEYPLVSQADILIAFSKNAYETDRASLKAGGLLLAERDLVPLPPDEQEKIQVCRVAAVDAADELGRRVVANIVLLGALAEVTDIVPADAVERAILDRVPKGTERLNLEAFHRGQALAAAEADPHNLGPDLVDQASEVQ